MRNVAIAAIPCLLVGCTSAAGAAVAHHSPTAASQSGGAPSEPSAVQLAHGNWARIASPPIRLCQPYAVWDGSALIVIEGGAKPCHPAAAVYYPKANRWATIATPPRAVIQSYSAAWGNGRLVLVSQRTGLAVAWRPGTRGWRSIPRIPASDPISVVWTGTTFLAITSRQAYQATGRAWAFTGSHWTSLPNLPPVSNGWYAATPAAVIDGAVYVLAHELHGRAGQGNLSGSSRLLRLSPSGWKVLSALPAAAPAWTYFLTAVDGSLLATGTGCTVLECAEEIGQAAVIDPGTRADVVRLSPPGGLGMPFPQGIAAGPDAVVVTYAAGGNTLAGGPASRAVEIYAPRSGRWLTGPRAPASTAEVGRLAYWTPYGVVSLGQGGGWILRPAASQPAG